MSCKNCSKNLSRKNRFYCSHKCKIEFEHYDYIEKWKKGEVDGSIRNYWGVSNHIKKYLFKKYDYKCSVCDWGERNPYTGNFVLEVEHIDGDCTNNKEDNLTILCPNHHALTKTYKGMNRGSGRLMRYRKNYFNITQDHEKKDDETNCKCGKKISKKSKFCSQCIVRPKKFEVSKDELHRLLYEENLNYTQIGKMFKVSDNAIRKRCLVLEIPLKQKKK